MNELPALVETAVELAEKLGCSLDYSVESIAALDELAQLFLEAAENGDACEETVARAAALFGAYLGETMLRNGMKDLGFTWRETEDGEFSVAREDQWLFPITKVYKRMNNGPEDSLMCFYEVSMSYAIGLIGLDDPRVHILSEESADP